MAEQWRMLPLGTVPPKRQKAWEQQEIRVGDVVQTRKKHPCGSEVWTVIRTGADIKMRCNGCAHVVMIDRETFLRRRKKLLEQGPEPERLPDQPIPPADSAQDSTT